MVAVRIDLSAFTNLKEKLELLMDPEYLLRPICIGLVDKMTNRIHVKGMDTLEEQIGTYNKSYLKYVREKKWNRTADSNIIVSLTRQLENDWTVTPTELGYGLGFKNAINLQKARWVELIKRKEIFTLSQSEAQYATEYLGQLIEETFQK